MARRRPSPKRYTDCGGKLAPTLLRSNIIKCPYLFFLSRIERNQKLNWTKSCGDTQTKPNRQWKEVTKEMRWAERTVRLRATRWEAEPELSQSSRRGSLYSIYIHPSSFGGKKRLQEEDLQRELYTYLLSRSYKKRGVVGGVASFVCASYTAPV